MLTLVRKLSSGEGNLSLAVTDKNVFFKFDNQKLSSNLIEGQFPNYRRVIPETQEYRLTVEKDALEAALKRVSLLVEQKSRRVFLGLAENSIEVASEESEIGMAREEVPCEYTGPEATIALSLSPRAVAADRHRDGLASVHRYQQSSDADFHT